MAIVKSDERHDRIISLEMDNAAEDYDTGHDLGYSDAVAGKPYNVPTSLNKDIQDGYRTGYQEYSFGANTGEVDLTGLTDDWENSPYYGGSA